MHRSEMREIEATNLSISQATAKLLNTRCALCKSCGVIRYAITLYAFVMS